MRALGDALVGLVDLGAGEAAAERQAEHLPITLLRRGQLRSNAALAERLARKCMQGFANDAEAASRGVLCAVVRVLSRGAPQDRQRLVGRLPQHGLPSYPCARALTA